MLDRSAPDMGVSTAVSFGPMTGDDEASNGGFVLPFKVNGVEVGVSSSSVDSRSSAAFSNLLAMSKSTLSGEIPIPKLGVKFGVENIPARPWCDSVVGGTRDVVSFEPIADGNTSTAGGSIDMGTFDDTGFKCSEGGICKGGSCCWCSSCCC